MSDKSEPLRLVPGLPREQDPPRKSIAITGGKGGVGKSTVAINLAMALAQQRSRTLIVDSDLGMADLNLLLGVAPEKSLLDALAGAPLDEVLVEVHGLHLMPALNGSYLLATLGPSGQGRILNLLSQAMERFDSLIIDVAAGIGVAQTNFGSAASDAIVVVNPEPLSMADAYACIKVLNIERRLEHVYVLPNRVSSRYEADDLVQSLGALVRRFLDIELTALPPIPADVAVGESARVGIPLLAYRPESPAARAFRQVERALSKQSLPRSGSRPIAWRGTSVPAQGEPR